MDVESHTSEARSWSDSPPCALGSGQGMVAVFVTRGKGDNQLYGELMSGWLTVTREHSRGAGVWNKYVEVQS